MPAGKMLTNNFMMYSFWLEKLVVDSSGQEMCEIYGNSRCIVVHTKAHAQILI
jgi:hypothetical protein